MNGSWNGLVAELINHETDLVMTSLKINSARYEDSFILLIVKMEKNISGRDTNIKYKWTDKAI